MAYREDEYEEDDEAERDDPEAPDEADVDGNDDEAEVVPCPYCRGEIYEAAEVCPHCGSYVSSGDAPWRRPWWLVAGVAVCIVVVLIWIVR